MANTNITRGSDGVAITGGAQPDGSNAQVVEVGASGSIATSQVSVATTAGGTQIVPARASRRKLTITNTGTNAIFLGNTGVTIATGSLLNGVVGTQQVIYTTGAVFGIVSTTATTVSVLEEFD